MQRAPRVTKTLLALIILLATTSLAHASLSVIHTDKIVGKDTPGLLNDVKMLEEVAANWSPEWNYGLPKENAVSLAKDALRKIDALIPSANGASAGELLLLKGLTAHYAYNLDLKEDFDVAVDSLQKARKALPGDCRPLWFLGNHYSKGADPEKGVPLLKQAAQECGDALPLSFWEDYAYAAVLGSMPATATYALDQVKTRNGGTLTQKMKPVQEGVWRKLVQPVRGKEYRPEEIWQFEPKGKTTRMVNCMYGVSITVPGTWQISPFGVREGSSGIAIKFPAKGKKLPPLEGAVFFSPVSSEAAPEMSLRRFVAQGGTKRSYQAMAGPGVPGGDKFQWIESRQKNGSRILAGVIRRPQLAYPGLLLESPQNIEESADDQSAPHYYAPVEQFTRVTGDLDYVVMIEGAPAAFDKTRAELEQLLRNLVIE